MIGAALQAGRIGVTQVPGELRVAEIAALGRLDIDKPDAAARYRVPIDPALMRGDIDPAHRVFRQGRLVWNPKTEVISRGGSDGQKNDRAHHQPE